METFLVVLIIIISTVYFIDRSFLKAELKLLKKLFNENSDTLSAESIEKIPLRVIMRLRNNIISFYTKRNKELEPGEIGGYFLELNNLKNSNKKLLLMHLNESSMTCISITDLAKIYFESLCLESKTNSLIDRRKLQLEKKLILSTVLKEGKDSELCDNFYFELTLMAFKNPLIEEQTILFTTQPTGVEG